MPSRSQILKTHYVKVLQKAATWVGLGSLVAMTLVAAPASAGGAQITNRSTTLSSSSAASSNATTSYALSFKLPSSGATIEALMFQVCTSPLETTSCSTPTGASLSAGPVTLSAQGGQFSGWTLGAGTPPAPTANTAYIFNASGFSENTSTTQALTFNNIQNPTTVNQEYYVRITTYTGYNGSGGTGEQDFGAMAVATTQSLSVDANVQESLEFCVGTVSAPSNCGAESGSTVNIGSGTDNVLSSSAPSGAISTMIADTNATTGYVITYYAGNLSSSSDTITAIAGTPTTFPSAGTAAFGINLRANTSPSITNSADKAGSGSGAVAANYNTVNQFAFVPSTTTTVATASAPTVANTYTVSYAAQAGSTTKPGAFATSFNYVATGTF